MIGKVILPFAALAIWAFGQNTETQNRTTVVTTQVNLSSQASAVVQQIDAARQAIARNECDAALAHVNQALENTNTIQSAAAAANIGSPPQGKLLIPISGEIETESLYGQVKRSKSGTMSASRMKRNTNVREVTGQVTRTSLDVGAARANLLSAQTALASDNLTAADAALAAAQGNVVTETVTQNLPLLRAGENLALARTRVLDGKYKAAKMPLISATQALADYQRSSPGPHAAEAGDMRVAIAAYADKIGSDHADALDRIRAWSEKVDAWSKEAAVTESQP